MTTIAEWQARSGAWTDSRFPDDTIKDRGLILGEETGEVLRCIIKAANDIRGGTEHWNTELRKEAVDVFFTLVALAHRADFDLEAQIEQEWPRINAIDYATNVREGD